MATVTLLENPRRRRRRNPSRRRRRMHRNPRRSIRSQANDFGSQFVAALPPLTGLLGGLAGAAVASEVPTRLGATRWMNVLWSAVGTIGGSMVLSMLRQRDLAAGFAVGGGVITVAKIIFVGSNGRWALDPSTPISGRLDIGRRRRRRNPYEVGAGEDQWALPAGDTEATYTGTLTSGVKATRLNTDSMEENGRLL